MDKKQYKQLLLDELYAPYKTCSLCPLAQLGRTNVVFGEGNPDAQLMLIGEGPGQDEDVQGRPFVGRSGKLLTKALETLGISRTDLYIANIVKCRPPDNRAPLPQEVSICKKLLLDKQIKIIRPQVICTLGSSAINALLETKLSITKIRGTLFDYQGIPVLPTFHPAYILRNGKELIKMVYDLETAFSMTLNNFQKSKSSTEKPF